MPETPIKKTRNKLAKIYGVGILAFTAVLGSITVLASFLARLNMT
jgi:hypothetical protein